MASSLRRIMSLNTLYSWELGLPSASALLSVLATPMPPVAGAQSACPWLGKTYHGLYWWFDHVFQCWCMSQSCSANEFGQQKFEPIKHRHSIFLCTNRESGAPACQSLAGWRRQVAVTNNLFMKCEVCCCMYRDGLFLGFHEINGSKKSGIHQYPTWWASSSLATSVSFRCSW